MGENDKKEEKKDKLFCKRDIVIIVITLLASIVLIFFIAVAVKINEGKEWISLEGWLAYYGSICGAVFGGIITAVGLYITFRVNNKQLEEQRHIDNERWENSNRQFNQQMKIQIINEKIKDYKRCIDEINNFIDANEGFHLELVKYSENATSFLKEVNNIERDRIGKVKVDSEYYFENICKKYTSDLDVFNFENIYDGFRVCINMVELVSLNCECIIQKEITIDINRYLSYFIKPSNKYFNDISSFNYKNDFTKNYKDYFENSKALLLSYNREIIKLVDSILEYTSIINNTKVNFKNIKTAIRDEIGKLYKQKYNLYKEEYEQKTSNNI